MSQIWGLILAGGNGTRLWPHSREDMPKQFLSFGNSEESLFILTVKRLMKLTGDNFIVVCSSRCRHLAEQQLFEICKEPSRHLVIEPASKNTAPALALGISYIIEHPEYREGNFILATPSDHYIEDIESFEESMRESLYPAECGLITSFGITPRCPDTGFGYIKCSGSDNNFLRVEEFIEKPDLPRAQKFMLEGNYYWNSGMFMFRPSVMLKEMEVHAPDIFSLCSGQKQKTLSAFENMRSVSIDHAVMEKSDKIAMVQLKSDWTDLGSWDSVYSMSSKDTMGNAIQGEVMLIEGKDNLVSSKHRLVAGIGILDMIVIDTPDALLIAPRGESQKVRDLVQKISHNGRSETSRTPVSYRPWGKYEILFENRKYKLKRLVLHPGGKTSLQYHVKRTEHWFCVSGDAMVNLDREIIHMSEGDNLFIPQNVSHRLENTGTSQLEVIEIQKGDCFDEHDIVRLDDAYGRS